MLVTLYLVVSLACKFPIVLPRAFLLLISIQSGFHKYPLMWPKRLECDVTQYIDPVCLSPQLLRIYVIHQSQVHVVSFTRCDTSFNFHPSLRPRVHFAGGELYYLFITGNPPSIPYPVFTTRCSLLSSFADTSVSIKLLSSCSFVRSARCLLCRVLSRWLLCPVTVATVVRLRSLCFYLSALHL